MNYHIVREFAASFGLLFMVVSFVVMILWAYRPKAKAMHQQAAMMIFGEEEADLALSPKQASPASSPPSLRDGSPPLIGEELLAPIRNSNNG